MSLFEVRVGERVWLDGQPWLVEELSGASALIRHGSTFHRVALERLRSAVPLGGDATERPLEDTESWSAAGKADQSKALHRARVVEEILRSESRAAMTAAADAEGVSVRTIQRWITAYRDAAAPGLLDGRPKNRRARRATNARWDQACFDVLRQYTVRSTPTKGAVIDQANRLVVERFGTQDVTLPSRPAAYRRLDELSKGRHTFGSAKNRRSVANRPAGPYGHRRATRPGEFVVLDTTPLDVFAMEPLTMRWVGVELTVAMDLYSRCILGLRLTPTSTTSADVANVLYQCVAPRGKGSKDGDWPFHGVPANLLVGTEIPDGVSQERVGWQPACLPEAIIVDHGRVYLSDHTISACARLGITVQPALPYTPTDKPTVERFFRTLREGLLQHLPGYKGPDVYSRGKDVEGEAFYYVSELEQIIREWVGSIYHRTKHSGLVVPQVPGAQFSPLEMFEIGLAKHGGLLLPADPNLRYWFLDVKWRTVQHYGVEVDGRRYDGEVLNPYRDRRSDRTGPQAGKWPIYVDRHDVRSVWFRDPQDGTFHALEWEHAAGIDEPFGEAAAQYTKKVALRKNRHVEPRAAVHDLLSAWTRGETTSRRDRSLARRLAAQTEITQAELEATAPPTVADLPGVVNLTEEREKRQIEAVDDLDDIFAAYYTEHPDQTGLEVFDE